MAGLCESGNEAAGSLKLICNKWQECKTSQINEILLRLRDTVRRRSLNLWQGQNWVLHHDNVPAYRSLLVSEFLAQHKIPVLPQPPYSPDLAASDFYLFSKVKSLLKGRRFASAEEMKIHATSALREVTKDGLQECLEK
ncbi:hypothetical protein ANN_05123 [Periplaneta americana]|uniref:Mariner Mos1 transposase n=1 Tax=Periplaneta americana TaxID=6978 RepID=A0ABQ8TAD3_PERAM|nr:hypothetical protein ANN_05123 [Periplaneta americana]